MIYRRVARAFLQIRDQSKSATSVTPAPFLTTARHYSQQIVGIVWKCKSGDASESLNAVRLVVDIFAPVRPTTGDGYDLTRGTAGILYVWHQHIVHR